MAVAQQLGIEAHGPVNVDLPSGGSYEFSVLLPQFGAQAGMLLHTEYNREACAAATRAGYGFSILDPSSEPNDEALHDYIECLTDWGWTSQQSPPAWYNRANSE
jgi:hypothetical protein